MLNYIIRFSLKNQLLVLVFAVILICYGSYQATRLPIDVLPDLSRPRVIVIAECPGMAPEEVETLVTTPIETYLNGATGITSIRSSSTAGLSMFTKLNTAKTRLGSAIKRFRQATDLLDEFFKLVLPGQEKPDWNTMPPEYHLLDDCRSSIHGMRQQTLRLLYQILHVKRIESQRLYPENKPQEEIPMKRNWQVVDESPERPGYICLAIREEESGRLIADLADYPNDVPGFVERVKEEANIIASAKELRDTLQKLVDCAEPILVEFETEARKKCMGEGAERKEQHRFEFVVDEAANLLKKIGGE